MTSRGTGTDPEPKRGPIAWMVSNHVTPNIIMVVLLVGGLFMAINIKKEVFPEFDMDRVRVTVSYPGASPAEVEQGIDVGEFLDSKYEAMGCVKLLWEALPQVNELMRQLGAKYTKLELMHEGQRRGIPLAILCFENPFFGLNAELMDEIKTHHEFYSFFVWDSFFLNLLGKVFKNCYPIQHAADIDPDNSTENNREIEIQRDIAFVGNISDFPTLRKERLAHDDIPNIVHIIYHQVNKE